MTEEQEVPTAQVPMVERVPAGDGSALVAGPGEEQYQVSGVASNGSTVLAVGSRSGEDLSDRRPALLSSSDGRTWDAAGESLDETTWLNDVAAAGEELIVAGNAGDDPMVWPFADGKLGGPRPVAFPEGEGSRFAEAAVAVESRLYILGLRVNVPGGPGPIDADNPPTASVVLTASDDQGKTWTPVETPAALTPIESNDALLEMLAGGGSGVGLTLTAHGDGVLATVAVPGADGTVTTMWRLAADGTWTDLGTTADLLEGERLDLTTPDLETWDRALSDAALASSGEVWPRGVVALGDDVVIVGTHERLATTEEVDAHNEEAEDGQPPLHPLAQNAAAWIVSFEERPVVDPPAQATPLDVTGLKGDVTIRDVVEYDGRLVAAGWTTKEGEDGDVVTAGVWTSTDGESWKRVKAPEVGKPRGQQVHALLTTDDGLVWARPRTATP